MKKEVKRRLLEFLLRAILWAGLSFVVIPYGFIAFKPFEPFLVMNANVAGMFVLALVIVFVIWRRDALLKKPLAWRPEHLGIAVPAALFFYLAFIATYRVIINETVMTKALYIAMPPLLYAIGSLFLAMALFGTSLFTRERKALVVGTLVAVPYVSLSLLLRGLWPYLSSAVLAANQFLLGLTGDVVRVIPGGAPTLALANFIVVIGEACSGVDSAIMFTGVYIFIAVLDWKRLKHKLLWSLFPLGLIGMFCVNILRVALLMLIGAYWSPEFALSMFHENAGWVLFVLYTLGFWYIVYPHATTKR